MKKSLLMVLFTAFMLLTLQTPVDAAESGKVVILDPGHGGRYSGTAGYSGSSTGYVEKVANLEAALKVRDVLESKGYTVHMTRYIDKDFGSPLHTDLRNRVDLANDWAKGNNDNSIFISIHHNAAPYGPGVRGYETYFFNIDNGVDPDYPPDPMQKEYSPESKRLAYDIHNQVLSDVPISEGPQGITGNDLFVTRNAQMPSVLMELGYMSNPQEEKLIKTDSYQRQVAKAIGEAVDKFFNVYEVYDYKDNRLKIFEHKDDALNYAKSKENVYVFDKANQKRIFNNIDKRYGVYHTSVSEISKLFYSKQEALNYAEDWKHTRVVDNDTGEILWSNYLSKDFVVEHPANGILSRNYQAQSAIDYAKKWKHTAVIDTATDQVLWTNYLDKKYTVKHPAKGVLKEFYHKGPAVDYAKTWGSTTVVRDGSVVWENPDKDDSYKFKTEEVSSHARETTAVEVSKALYPNGFPGNHSNKTVILSTSRNHADALSAAPLAAQLGNAPILLSRVDSIRSEVMNEINRLHTKRVIILGGPNAISPGIEQKLKAKGYDVDRIAGKTRIETNQKINDHLNGVKGAFVASGRSFPDALGAAPIAAMKDWAIVLTDDKMDDKSMNYAKFKNIAIVGGDGVVSSQVEEKLIAQNGKDRVVRLAGKQRYETQKQVLNYFKDDLSSSYVLAATGEKFPDALTASSLAVKHHAPLVLIGKDVDPATRDFLESYGNSNVVKDLQVVGGVLSDSSVEKVSNYLK
ncbi:N-acetylmuramoyl-L-alanine amidase [Halobacillus salinarum]|uniref:N-acetylmuramoyl-L-alanine amidase n=1 Tax=Halobacillus salinarum TaxID=2932257 RepID=A0ABY4EML3_9BACI|nr:cell wall-binding repeat-containing protein [Halobacillus salinarum]UOQ45697.1 N-acetylmuramoyl-L-alanine amidase [Halobacillus salinarum]